MLVWLGALMKNYLGIAKPPEALLLALAFALVCFGILIAGVGPTRQQSRSRNDIKIINKTTTLEVDLSPIANNHLLIRLKNLSSRNLNGYVISVDRTRIDVDISSGDRVVSSGQTED